jgi:DNA-binding Lrp family transcriptional regulator
MDAYVFVKGATREYLDTMLNLAAEGVDPAIRYAAVLTGEFDGVVACEVADFQALEALVFQYFRDNPVTSTAVGLCPPPPRECKMPKKKHRVVQVEAFLRIWVQSGRGQDVVDELVGDDGFRGIDGIEEAGVVAADFDVLTVLCAETLDEFRARLLYGVQRVPSVIKTSTGFVVRSARRPEPEQQA